MIKIKNLLVLVGRNNAGKSNILQALNLFFDEKKSSAMIPRTTISGGFQPSAIIVEIKFEDFAGEFKRKYGLTGASSFTVKKDFPIDYKKNAIKSPEIYINDKKIANIAKESGSKKTELKNDLSKECPKFYYVAALRDLSDQEKFKQGTLIQELILPLLDDKEVDDGNSLDYHLSAVQEILNSRISKIEEETNSMLAERIDDLNALKIQVERVDIKKAIVPGLFIETKTSNAALAATNQGAGTQNFDFLKFY
jgi:predicted ATP-dependent endonuclease of OLD family